MRFVILCATLVLASFPAPMAHAHPLQAEPIKHPYVFTFDQFNIAEDPDEALVNGGLLLMAETRCTACHEAPAAWQAQLAASSGPDLRAVGSRLDADTLWLLIRSPQHRKIGTLMPGMFDASDEDAPEKVEAITQYLLTLRHESKAQSFPKGDAEHGKQLYHSVGCVACHQPASDFRPPQLPANLEPERPGNASVPIALADAYELTALTQLLSDPLSQRPAGRMPAMQLSPSEAADIAAYLHIGRTAEKALEREALHLPPQSAEVGKKLFSEQRCTVCHDTGETLPKRRAAPLDKLKWDSQSSCLADEIAAGTPRFGFNDLQLRSLRIALQHLQQQQHEPQTAAEKIDWQMLRLNCYACHDRDGKGGPEEPRAAYFRDAGPSAEALGETAKLPPTLDFVGWKLTPQWLAQMLGGGPHEQLRGYLSARMPVFGKEQTAMLSAWFLETDKPTSTAQKEPKESNAEAGRQIFGEGGLGCMQCHSTGNAKVSGRAVFDLRHSLERLQASYFEALLLTPEKLSASPGMQCSLIARPTNQAEVSSLWQYMTHLPP